MELQEALRRRKMVRTFRQDTVARDVIARVLASVVHAPSAGFTQGNEFLVLDDAAAIDDFFALTRDPDDDELVPAGSRPTVVVLPLAHKQAYLDRYSEGDKAPYGLGDELLWPVPYWDVDAGMATMLILLVAVEAGLGAWFSGIFTGEAAVLERFGVPSCLRPIGFVGLGHPAAADPVAARASSATRRRRRVDELVHYNGW